MSAVYSIGALTESEYETVILALSAYAGWIDLPKDNDPRLAAANGLLARLPAPDEAFGRAEAS